MRPTFADTLADLERRYLPRPASAPAQKLAQSLPGLDPSLAQGLRKVAAELRAARPEPLQYAVLHRLKEAGWRAPEIPCVPEMVEGSPSGQPLHKLAHLLRVEARNQEVRAFEKAAQAIRAAQGLTLLRDMVRSPR